MKKNLVPTSQQEMDAALQRLKSTAAEFAGLSLDERIVLAESMKAGYVKIAEESVNIACKAKGIPSDAPVASEEWGSGPWGIVRQLRLTCESLRSLKKTGNTPIKKISRNIKNNLSVRVFPGNAIDAMLFKNVTADLHLLPSTTEKTLEKTRASFYKNKKHNGKVALVLGAGNVAGIGMMDVITKMFNEGKVCALKMNPVNSYLGPFIEMAFKDAITKNYLTIFYGESEVGKYLVYHPMVDEIHLTGSEKTFNQIVWGTSEIEVSKLKEKKLKIDITSELGNISPVIIIPGPYSKKEIAYQAEMIATAMTMNGSFLCNAAKLLVMPKGWSGRESFLTAIQKACSAAPLRLAYYPGALDRWKYFTKNRKNILNIGKGDSNHLPWSFITNLDPEDSNEPLFKEETFCSVFAEVQIGSSDTKEFLKKATEFVNSRVWGTLNITLLVHPKILKDPNINSAFEHAISDLKYGTVAVNTYPGLSFSMASSAWGAYPGSSFDNIQSGSGFVHNTSMIEDIEKTVLRAPLVSSPKAAFLPSHKNGHVVMKKMIAMEEHLNGWKVPGIIWSAITGG